MFCCGGGPTYYIFQGVAASDTPGNLYLLLKSPDDYSGELVEYNFSTSVKTTLVSFSSYDKILCHLRRYSNYLYVLYYDYSYSTAFIDIYTIGGSLVETIDVSTVVGETIVYPIKLAIYDTNNIYLLTSGGVGEDNVYWLMGSWSCPLSFCKTGVDFAISSMSSIEITGGDYVYIVGTLDLIKYIKWFNRTTGEFVGSQVVEDNIEEMYYER